MQLNNFSTQPTAVLIRRRDELNELLEALERDRRLHDRVNRIERISASLRDINLELGKRGCKR